MLTLNGQPRPLEQMTTVADVVAAHHGGGGVAVALNGAIVPRSRWADQPVHEGDVVDLVVAAQGG